MLGMGDEAGVEDTGLFAGERFSGTKTVRNMSTITDLYMCSNLIYIITIVEICEIKCYKFRAIRANECIKGW